MARLWRPKTLLLAASFAILCGAGWLVWRAQRTLDETQAEIRAGNEIRTVVRPLDRTAVPGLEAIAASSVFRDAAIFQDRLWVLSSDALWEYGASGEVVKRYRCGEELPPAPLVRLAAGAAGSREPELFIATQGEGLVVYDGRGAFRQVRPERAEHRKLTALLPLDSGQILLGTEQAGVFAWDGKDLSRYHESLGAVRVTALAGALDDLWVGTLDQGAIHWKAGQMQRFGEAEGLPDSRVLSLAVRGQTAWAGSAMGIAEFQRGKLERVIAQGVFAKTLLPADEHLMVGTMEEGVLDIPLAVRQPRPGRNAGESSGQVERLLALGETAYAVFRDALFVRRARQSGWSQLAARGEALLTDNNIAALAVEPSGRVWVGYFDRGLDIVDPGAAHAIHREDEHVFCVNRIVPRKDGVVIATANGLVLANAAGETRQVLGRKEGLIASHVTDVLVEGDALVAATPAGLTFLAPGGPQSIYAFHGLVNNHVYSLARNGNRLLAGTLGGVSVLDNGIVKANFTTANSALRHNWISALTAVGDEWFAGTYGAGVFRYDGTTWQGFSDLRTGFEVNPNAMAASGTAVYAGTLDRGLAVFHRANGRWGFQTAGLPSANVTAVALGNGYLYVGTDNGLVRIPERSVLLP